MLINDRFINANVYKLVAYEIDFEIVNALERSALHITIKTNDFLLIETFLKYCINTSIQNKENNTIYSYLNKIKCLTNINLKA